MRAALGWLGFRERWSTSDSSGTGVLAISPAVIPTIVVGADSDDTHSYNWAALEIPPTAGLMSFIAFVPEQNHWVEEIQVFEVVPANSDIFLRLEPNENPTFPGVANSVLFPGFGAALTGGSTATPPAGNARMPLQKPGGAPNGYLRWAPPGILVRVGQRLWIQSDANNVGFAAGFNVRNA